MLARVSGLFSRRGFNIESLAVGPTEHPEISRITIVVSVEGSGARAGDQAAEQAGQRAQDRRAGGQRRPCSASCCWSRSAPTRRTRRGVLRDRRAVQGQGRRRRPGGADHRGHRAAGQARGDAQDARAVRHPRDGAVRHGRARPRPAVDDPGRAARRRPHAPNQRRSVTSTKGRELSTWPWRSTTTTTPTCRSSRAARSPSSATAARATRTRCRLRDSGVDVRVGLPEGSKSRAKAEDEGLRVRHAGRGLRRGRPDHDAGAGPGAAHALRRVDRAEPEGRRRALLRPRLQHPVRLHQAAGRRRRRDGRAEGPGPPGPPPVRRRQGRAGARRRRAGRHRQGLRRWRCPTPRRSAAPGPARSRPRSPRRPRPTCSASRPCCAAARRSW